MRFFNYIGDIVLHFDLGTSYATRQPVIDSILARFPNTLVLAVLSMCLSSILGISMGIFSAVRRYSVMDHVVVVALVFASMPGFWLGLMLLILSIQDLSVVYKTDLETVYAVNHISLDLNAGETWAWWARPARARPPRR